MNLISSRRNNCPLVASLQGLHLVCNMEERQKQQQHGRRGSVLHGNTIKNEGDVPGGDNLSEQHIL